MDIAAGSIVIEEDEVGEVAGFQETLAVFESCADGGVHCCHAQGLVEADPGEPDQIREALVHAQRGAGEAAAAREFDAVFGCELNLKVANTIDARRAVRGRDGVGDEDRFVESLGADSDLHEVRVEVDAVDDEPGAQFVGRHLIDDVVREARQHLMGAVAEMRAHGGAGLNGGLDLGGIGVTVAERDDHSSLRRDVLDERNRAFLLRREREDADIALGGVFELLPFVDRGRPDVLDRMRATRTIDEVGSLAELTTGSLQDPDLYRISLDEAIENGKPTVVVFASPAFCTNAVCGPQLDVLQELKNAHADRANFVHVDFYDNPHEIQGDLDRARISPAVRDWKLPSIEWTFVIDSAGIVTARFEGFATYDEVEVELIGAGS